MTCAKTPDFGRRFLKPSFMNILILGQTEFSKDFASILKADPRHRVVMTCPPLPGFPGTSDLETALATADVDAALIGGAADDRGEWLRRCSSLGWICLCDHPPGLNTDPYYQVSLSRHEFNSLVLPNLPLRFHPGIQEMLKSISPGGEAWPVRLVVLETGRAGVNQSLVLEPFAQMVDMIRLLIGDVENIAAMGFPAGTSPTERLTVQLRGSGERRAEVTVKTGVAEDYLKLTVSARHKEWTLECNPAGPAGGRLSVVAFGGEGANSGSEMIVSQELPDWSPAAALVEVWTGAALREAEPVPGLMEGIRAMEVAEGAMRSLRRGRAIDLYYEEISEANNFKTIMTSVGCLMVFGVIFGLPLILAGPAIGLPFTLYLGYLIPLAFGGFALLQFLKFAIKGDSKS